MKAAQRARDAVDYYNDGRRWYDDPRPPRPGTNPLAPTQRRPASSGIPLPPANQQSTSEPALSSRRVVDDLDWAAEVFQVRRSDLRRASSPKPKYGEPRRERLSPEDLKWVEIFFDLSAKQVWTDAGLRPRDAELAKECVDAGLRAHHLGCTIGSSPVWWWITEGGRTPAWAAQQMRLRRDRGSSNTG